MAPTAQRCFLRSCALPGSSPSSALDAPDVALPDGVRVVLGRGPETKIKDRRCSRQQVALVASYAKFSVKVEQVGSNASAVNGAEVGSGAEAGHGDIVEVLKGQFGLKVVFVPAPEQTDSGGRRAEKRPAEDEKTKSVTAKKAKEGAGKTAKLWSKLDLTVTLLETRGRFKWEEVAGGKVYVMTTEDCRHRKKIAAFDLDGTLITTKSGRVFPKDIGDWQLLLPEVPATLKRLHAEGHKVVVITNQAGMASGKLKLADFMTKAESVAKRLGVPLQLFCCAADGGPFRKPRTGVWRLLCTAACNGSELPVDAAASFYCGDAAGRAKDWQAGKKKDFSCSDRLFALNVGLDFKTPEELFQGQKATKNFSLPEFDPTSVKTDVAMFDPPSTKLTSDSQEVIMLVGIQGSGKSFIAERHLQPHGYVVASNDKSGGRDKTLKLVDSALSSGKSVVIDNTHGEKETRKKFLDVAKRHRVPCRCFVMQTTPQQARHNNLFRELTSQGHARIKEMLFHTFKAKYQEPAVDEGFAAVVKVNFVPDFSDEDEEALYRSYLQEK